MWEREAWLDLLARFVHVVRPEKGSAAEKRAQTRIVFPRFHQWDAVRRLEAAAREDGAGRGYLVEHSAGSGKSNSIAWLAHRLSSLHDAADRKVFDKVVVITDRLVLDRQLQETIYGIEHVHGVVVRIDRDSQQLADALAGEQAQIIVTTLQKFPYVLDKIEELPARRYAVIVDEAHSSQTGEAAADLRRALWRPRRSRRRRRRSRPTRRSAATGRTCSPARSRVAAGPATSPSSPSPRPRRRRRSSCSARRSRPRRDCATGRSTSTRCGRRSRRASSSTCSRTTRPTRRTSGSRRPSADDPEYDTARARQAIARFVTLHPHNLAQRAEIVVEHFRAHTAKKIGGRAKAMVVTSSRLHAVRYKLALDSYIREHSYTDVRTLVAFSGKVLDEGDEFTEPGMNGFPESETAERFGGDDYQVLIVAEKFQTGFDQPLLHTMYVDKVLTGLNAVQTLSRLNRILPPAKTDTFVLDFRNETEEIQEAFRPWYERTDAVPTDPNLLYDTHRALWDFDVLRDEEVEAGVQALLVVTETSGHGAVYAALDPARDRFLALDEEVQDAFRDLLVRFVNLYAFVSQIVSYVDRRLERDYLYARALNACLPGQQAERLDLGSEVALTHLKIARTHEGSASLEEGGGEVVAIFSGRGPEHEPEKEHLSRIVDVMNERFGLELGDADQLLFDQFEESWAADESLAARARNNDFQNFRLVFDRTFLDTVVKRMDENSEIFRRILDEPATQQTRARLLRQAAVRAAPRRARPARPDRDALSRLHPVGRVHPDEPQGRADHRPGRAAEAEAERLLVALEHAVVVVEAVELVGDADRVGR